VFIGINSDAPQIHTAYYFDAKSSLIETNSNWVLGTIEVTEAPTISGIMADCHNDHVMLLTHFSGATGINENYLVKLHFAMNIQLDNTIPISGATSLIVARDPIKNNELVFNLAGSNVSDTIFKSGNSINSKFEIALTNCVGSTGISGSHKTYGNRYKIIAEDSSSTITNVVDSVDHSIVDCNITLLATPTKYFNDCLNINVDGILGGDNVIGAGDLNI
jgi:hypothetical protein